MIPRKSDQKPFVRTWELERKKRYQFPIVVPNSECSQLSSIHPLKQAEVSHIYELAKRDERIARIVVFGSSLNMRCNIDSDLDICIFLKPNRSTPNDKNQISEKLQESCSWNLDILWGGRISESEKIYEEIKQGVIII